MNYLTEIIAFEQWLESHYLSNSSQLLWYRLMAIFNRSGWCEWVVVDNLRLMAAMQIGREATVIKARDELIKAGLIEYQKGKKGSPNKYRIISFTCKRVVQSEVNKVVKTVVQSEVKEVVQSADIYKLKQNKTKEIPIVPYEQIIGYLNKKTNKSFKASAKETQRCIKARFSDGFVYEDFLKVIDTKCEKWLSNNEMCDYLRPQTLFGTKFESYLNESRGCQKGKPNKFADFKQNDYDFDELERVLTGG